MKCNICKNIIVIDTMTCLPCKMEKKDKYIAKLEKELAVCHEWYNNPNKNLNDKWIREAMYTAESVLHIFEEQFPNDRRPREAIEAAKKCIENPSEENKKKEGREYDNTLQSMW